MRHASAALPFLAMAVGPVYRYACEPSRKHRRGPEVAAASQAELAADFAHRLKRISEVDRQAILTRTAGALSPVEAGELERVIDEGCEQVDEHGW